MYGRTGLSWKIYSGYTWMTGLENGSKKPGRSKHRWKNIKMDLK
jgi:hypothetical protein